MLDLRKEVKLLKALQGITYKELASYIEIETKSFYSWLYGQYNFGEEREERLRNIISLLKE